MNIKEISNKPKIVVVGSGNVATHLARGFADVGCDIVQVYSHKLEHAKRLATSLDSCEAIDKIDDIVKDADLYLIAVKDEAIREIARNMPKVRGVAAHTSGSIPLSVLSEVSDNTAVLYPLQTFSREAELDLSRVPFFTEAINEETQRMIDGYAYKLSKNVRHADSSQRKTLHIAGVLSCNFVNFLWDKTAEILSKDGYEFDVVEPLIRATLDKAIAIGPHDAQTGPAMRNDKQVMEEHAARLDDDIAKLYREISQAIIKSHNIDE